MYKISWLFCFWQKCILHNPGDHKKSILNSSSRTSYKISQHFNSKKVCIYLSEKRDFYQIWNQLGRKEGESGEEELEWATKNFVNPEKLKINNFTFDHLLKINFKLFVFEMQQKNKIILNVSMIRMLT